jgi:hypothetical protein
MSEPLPRPDTWERLIRLLVLLDPRDVEALTLYAATFVRKRARGSRLAARGWEYFYCEPKTVKVFPSPSREPERSDP